MNFVMHSLKEDNSTDLYNRKCFPKLVIALTNNSEPNGERLVGQECHQYLVQCDNLTKAGSKQCIYDIRTNLYFFSQPWNVISSFLSLFS